MKVIVQSNTAAGVTLESKNECFPQAYRLVTMYYGLISSGKKKIKDIKNHYHTAVFLLRKFVKLDEIIELNFPSDPTEIHLLLVTEIL